MSALPEALIASLYARALRKLARRPDEPVERDPADRAEASAETLSTADGAALWSALLAERFVTAQEAALLLGLRVHGETGDLLAAFAQVTRQSGITIPVPAAPTATVVIHAYGTARRHPVLVPLLAQRVAALGVATLLVTHDAGRGANATALLHAMRVRRCEDDEDASQDLRKRRFAWLPLEAMNEPLARLVARSRLLGFRTTASQVARLLAPVRGAALLVADYRDAYYCRNFGQAAQALHLSALLVHATDGDPVAADGDAHPMQAWRSGLPQTLPAVQAGRPSPFATVDTVLPAADDIPATARFTAEALAGQTLLPAAIERQAQVIVALAGEVGSLPDTRGVASSALPSAAATGPLLAGKPLERPERPERPVRATASRR